MTAMVASTVSITHSVVDIQLKFTLTPENAHSWVYMEIPNNPACMPVYLTQHIDKKVIPHFAAYIVLKIC